MNTVMFNELPVGALFRVVNKSKAKTSHPISDTDIFIKVKNTKGKYRAFNITDNQFMFYGPIDWDYAPIYPECKDWECEKVEDFCTRTVSKTSTEKRLNCILGSPDWNKETNAYLSLTKDQIMLLDYLINETDVFDEDVELTVVDTDFKAF